MADRYPDGPGVRGGSPETALDAAASVSVPARSRELKALRLIRASAYGGCTADEVACALEWERYSARPRLSTMRACDQIVDSGLRRRGVSSRWQAVWVVPEYAPPAGQTPT